MLSCISPFHPTIRTPFGHEMLRGAVNETRGLGISRHVMAPGLCSVPWCDTACPLSLAVCATQCQLTLAVDCVVQVSKQDATPNQLFALVQHNLPLCWNRQRFHGLCSEWRRPAGRLCHVRCGGWGAARYTYIHTYIAICSHISSNVENMWIECAIYF